MLVEDFFSLVEAKTPTIHELLNAGFESNTAKLFHSFWVFIKKDKISHLNEIEKFVYGYTHISVYGENLSYTPLNILYLIDDIIVEDEFIIFAQYMDGFYFAIEKKTGKVCVITMFVYEVSFYCSKSFSSFLDVIGFSLDIHKEYLFETELAKNKEYKRGLIDECMKIEGSMEFYEFACILIGNFD